MESTVITALVGVILCFISFELGNRLNGKNKVSDLTCQERRSACDDLLCAKLEAIHERIENFIRTVEVWISKQPNPSVKK